MLYPPFADLCVVGFSGQQEENVEQAARYFTRELIALAQAEYASLPMRVIGPAKAAVPKVSGRYRYKLIIKNRFDKSFRELIAYERGVLTIPVEHLLILADFYGVSTDYILGRTNNKKLNK